MKAVISKFFLLLVVIVAVNSLAVYAQPGGSAVNYPIITENIPPSPNATSLGKYGDCPVNLYAGQPSVSVPIYDLVDGDIQLKIDLSYKTGGIKVEEMASQVGLGWTLNAGGAITRTTRGIPDETNAVGYIYNNYTTANLPTGLDLYYDVFQPAERGELDLEPDVFYYNFMGKSGKFYLKKESNEVIMDPQQRVNIKYDINTTGRGHIERWTIIDENGYKYVFGRKNEGPAAIDEITTISDVRTGVSVSTNAWYLVEVTSPKGIGISFQYNNFSTVYSNKPSETLQQSSGTSTYTKSNTVSTLKGVELSRISGRFGRIEFQPAEDTRLDLYNCHALRAVKVYNSNYEFIKGAILNYDYFQCYDIINGPAFYINNRKYKLKLLSVQELPGELTPYANNFGVSKEYKFDYFENDNEFPERFSNSQDHWGYYNGISNTSLIPLIHYRVSGSNSCNPDVVSMGNASRVPVPEKAQIGTLKKINYPTGGYSEFRFEGNKAFRENFDFEFVTNYQLKCVLNAGAPDRSASTQQVVNPGHIICNFTVGENCGNIKIEVFNFCNCDWSDRTSIFCNANANLTNNTTGSFTPLAPGTSNYILQPGSYTVTLNINDYEHNPYKDCIVIKVWGNNDYLQGNYNKPVGGLRIAELADYDPIANQQLHTFYDYKKFETDDESGVLISVPNYYYETLVPINGSDALSQNVTSFSQAQLQTTQGNITGYSNVTVTKKLGGNTVNETRHVYSVSADAASSLSYPFAPPLSFESQRGNLENEQQMSFDENHNRSLVKETNNTYANLTPVTVYVPGIKIGCHQYFNQNGATVCGGIAVSGYYANSEIIKLVKTETRTFDAFSQPGPVSGGSIANTTEYNYQNLVHQQLTSTATYNSIESRKETDITYAQDYDYHLLSNAGDDHVKGLRYLYDNFIHTPVEQLSMEITSDGEKFITGGILYENSQFSPVLTKVYKLEINERIPVSDFTFSYINGYEFVKDARYKLQTTYNSYDATNNLLQQTATDGSHAAIWDYKNSYVTASATNTVYSDIGYSSFEADGMGSWDYDPSGSIQELSSPTGIRCFSFNASERSNSIVRRELNDKQIYMVTYWSKDGEKDVSGTAERIQGRTVNGWTYFEHRIALGRTDIVIKGTGLLDELRLFPKNAQMTTYTYNPLVGVTCTADPSSRITYYEYDRHGRLWRIRDENRHVLKQYEYKYKAGND